MPANGTSTEHLRVRRGQCIEAAHHNGLCDLAEQLTIQRGRLKGRQLPDGFIPRVDIRQTTSVDHPWKLAVSDGEAAGEWRVRFGIGNVEGVVPTISGQAMDEPDENGELPQLLVKTADFAPHGAIQRCIIYLRYVLLEPGDQLKSVEIIAASKKPDHQPWTWHKVAAFLMLRDGAVTPVPQMFFNQRFKATGFRNNGRAFTAWAWAD